MEIEKREGKRRTTKINKKLERKEEDITQRKGNTQTLQERKKKDITQRERGILRLGRNARRHHTRGIRRLGRLASSARGGGVALRQKRRAVEMNVEPSTR